MGLLLIVATRRLWFSFGEFPQVPFFEFLCSVPQWCDWVLSAGLILCLALMLLTEATSRTNLVAGFLGITHLVALIALNQHRLQPWAWFLILATLATSARAGDSLKWLRWLLFGVYFFSGLSKLEPSFVNGGGDWLLDGLLKPFGHSHTSLSAETRRLCLYLMPLGEVVAAFCVMVPRLRKLGFFLVLGMHGTLLFALGPFGLNHKPGVLLWNLEFQLLAFPLLWNLPTTESLAGCLRSRILGGAVIAGAVILPCFGQRWLPIVDQWPSWSVYATWSKQDKPIDVILNVGAYTRFPQQLPITSCGWFDYQRLRLDQWSLEATGAPLYPSQRFRFGVARGLVQVTGFQESLVPMDKFETANPSAWIVIGNSGGNTISEAASAYKLNSRPRNAKRWVLKEPPEARYLE
jgi:hypothetical protein